jgi:tRNA1Val (adenine37-N6)-methyltransferase
VEHGVIFVLVRNEINCPRVHQVFLSRWFKKPTIMANAYFKFKQFTIYQDNCAMKVCTDACLFGAWVACQFKENQPQRILDIGTGTGLLTLMLAQKLEGTIETIEIDQNAYQQAADNISKTSWSERIRAIHADVKQYGFEQQYDLIISNPPFYENDLRSPEPFSNMARHDETITLQSLLSIVALHLSNTGSFAVLIPYHRLTYCISIAEHYKLFPSKIVNVQPSTHNTSFRTMIVFQKHSATYIDEKSLSIKEKNNYTTGFVELLKDYYLYL